MPDDARAARHRRVLVPLLLALAALAWAALWAWAASPYGRYLAHGEWGGEGPLAQLCRAVPAATWLLHGLAWALMITAMMLPTTLPLFNAFARVSGGRADQPRLLALLGLGYLAVWGLFGLTAHGLQELLLAGVDRLPWLAWNAWAIGALSFALAGAFQFSALKHRCLDKCRTPLGFVIEHWRGRHPARQALALGAHHGLFCVGCCWALMLLMFVVGMGNLGWMLLLALLMAIEKNLPWGRRISAPLGLALLGGALWILLAHL